MTHPLLHTLKASFKLFLGFYVDTFPRAYASYITEKNPGPGWGPATPEQFQAYLRAYVTTIENNIDAIFRSAAQELGNYLNLYSIHANQSADEYKLIYFLGRAIGRHISATGLRPMAHTHSYAMIGLLGDRLAERGCPKPQLTRALKRLIKADQLDDQLGNTGLYLVYKCVSTVLDDAAKPEL
jgi:hypothetical protein